MATYCNNAEEEEDDFIDMELISSSNLFFYSTNSSPPQAREFEFQMCCSISDDQKETTNSPADELFYKGKLLPLHLPPRLQMVQNPIITTTTFQEDDEHHYKTNNNTSAMLTPCTANNSTPLDQSCNIFQSESCRICSELSPDEYIFEWSNESSGSTNGDRPKKSWSKKNLKLIKKSSLGQKLKASRAYLKSLFSKYGCSDESCSKAAGSVEEAGNLSKCNVNVAKKIPEGTKFPTIAAIMNMNSNEKEGFVDNGSSSHRKSFSGAMINRCPKMKCSSSSSSSSSSCDSFSSSSSFSFISNGVYELQLLKRSGSANSEIDGSIEAAIAHCKRAL